MLSPSASFIKSLNYEPEAAWRSSVSRSEGFQVQGSCSSNGKIVRKVVLSCHGFHHESVPFQMSRLAASGLAAQMFASVMQNVLFA